MTAEKTHIHDAIASATVHPVLAEVAADLDALYAMCGSPDTPPGPSTDCYVYGIVSDVCSLGDEATKDDMDALNKLTATLWACAGITCICDDRGITSWQETPDWSEYYEKAEEIIKQFLTDDFWGLFVSDRWGN